MKTKETKESLLAKLKLAEVSNELLRNEILDSDFQRVALLKSNEMLIKEKEADSELKKDYIDSYKHIRYMQKAKIEMKKQSQ